MEFVIHIPFVFSKLVGFYAGFFVSTQINILEKINKNAHE